MAVDKMEIQKEMREKVEEIRRYEPLDESLIVSQALRYGLVEMKKELAIRLFSEGRVTVSEAAKLAEKSVGEMMEILSRRGIKSNVNRVKPMLVSIIICTHRSERYEDFVRGNK